MTEIIKFASRKMPCYNFTNFALWKVMIDGHLWTTTEHYYQASKFEKGSANYLKIQKAKTPMGAAKLGRELKMDRPENWDDLKDNVMWVALNAKFDQYKHIKEELLETGDAILVEHRKADSYWGDAGDGSGVNMLGFQLMALRHIYRDENEEYVALVRDLFKQKYEGLNLLGVVQSGTNLIANTNSIDLSIKMPGNYLGVSVEISIYKNVTLIGAENA